MKKLLFFLLTSNFIFGQISSIVPISGLCSLTVGQQVTYSIPINSAQCNDCYDWDINNSNLTTSGNVMIVGSDQNNNVTIKALTAGTFTLKVTYFNENGCNVSTLACTPTIIPACRIRVTSSYSYSNNNTSILCTAQTDPVYSSGLTYTWTATFQAGNTETITTTNNQATFNFTPSNGIVSYTVSVVDSNNCRGSGTTDIPCNIGIITYTRIKDFKLLYKYTATASGATNFYWIFEYANRTYTFSYDNPANGISLCNNNSPLVKITIVASNQFCSKKIVIDVNPEPCAPQRISMTSNSEKLNLIFENKLDVFKGEIFSLEGILIKTFNNNDYHNIDISNFNKSIYIVKVYDEFKNEIFSEKLIKN